MTDITAGVWAANRQTFETLLAAFGLGAFVEGMFVPHPHLIITGGGYAGWPGILTDPTGETDEDGNPIYEARPGVYFNCIAQDIRNDPDRKSLARNLRHRVMEDGREVKYERYDENGNVKPLLQRTRLVDVGAASGGQYIATYGVPSIDTKMPPRIELHQNGELMFAAYSLEDGDIATPANVMFK